jgi:hypothetical protein
LAGVRRAPIGRRRGLRGVVGVVSAGGLDDPPGGESGRCAYRGRRRRVVLRRLLCCLDQLLAVGLLEIVTDVLDLLGRLLSDLRRTVLALLAQLTGDALDRLALRPDLLTDLRRLRINLCGGPILRLSGGCLRLLLGLPGDLLRLPLGRSSRLLGLGFDLLRLVGGWRRRLLRVVFDLLGVAGLLV